MLPYGPGRSRILAVRSVSRNSTSMNGRVGIVRPQNPLETGKAGAAAASAIIPHVFMPRKIPDEGSMNENDTDLTLIRNLEYAFYVNFEGANLGETRSKEAVAGFGSVYNFLSNSVQAQDAIFRNDAPKLAKLISEAKTLGVSFYLRNQNAGVMLITPSFGLCSDAMKNVEMFRVLSTFRASLDREEVTSSCGDFELILPQQSIEIPVSKVLKSEVLAEQICVLNAKSFECAMKKGEKAHNPYFVEDHSDSSPILVQEWLTTVLSCGKSQEYLEFPRIQKKIRDAVVKTKSGSFRRSGMWFALKTSLQLFCTLEFGPFVGKVTYKIITLIGMNNILKNLKADKDLCIQEMNTVQTVILPKMATRLMKLKKLVNLERDQNVPTLVQATMLDWALKCMKNVLSELQDTQTTLQLYWEDYNMQRCPKISIQQVQRISPYLIHSSDAIKEYIGFTASEDFKGNNRSSRVSEVSRSGPSAIRNKFRPGTIPELDFKNSSSLYYLGQDSYAGESQEEDFTTLCEAEICMQSYVVTCEAECTSLRRFMFEYSGKAIEIYKLDPLGVSRMLLTLLKCLYELDRFTCGQYPILKEYKSGIEYSVFSSMHLPCKEQMELAWTIEEYFIGRDSEAEYPSLVDEVNGNSSISNEFLGVRYASSNEEMGNALREIEEEDQRQVELKRAEVQKACEEYERLDVDCKSKVCNNVPIPKSKYEGGNWVTYEEYVHYEGRCTKCQIKTKMKKLVKSVRRYERPLPSYSIGKLAVIFELMMPSALACLRDCLIYWRCEIIRDIELKDNHGKYKWNTCDPVKKYNKNNSELAGLWSSCALSISNPNLKGNPSILVSDVNGNFILNNGYNYVLQAKTKFSDRNSWKFREHLSFKIAEEEYKSLQWTLQGTLHTPNQVLARQSDCHEELSLEEFKSYGGLRAGHKIQYSNLFMALKSGSLHLSSEAVFQLICQSIWQAETSSNSSVIREAHEHLLDKGFVLELLALMNKITESARSNWTEPLKLWTMAAMGTRILEATDDPEVTNIAQNLLKTIRQVFYNWINEIQAIILESLSSKSSSVSKSVMKSRLLDAALGIGLTFASSNSNINLLLQEETDLHQWLVALSVLHEEAPLAHVPGNTKSIIYRAVKMVSLKLESTVASMLKQDSEKKVLKKYVESRWNSCMPGQTLDWSLSGSVYKGSAKSIEGSSHTITLDVLKGVFLVDSFPLGVLPSSIKRSQPYQEVFGDMDFVVQPNSGNVFTTRGKYNGRAYSFSLKTSNPRRTMSFDGIKSHVIIKEITMSQDGDVKEVLELIPERLFEGTFSSHFVKNFSHWYNRETNLVQFREKLFTNPKFHTGPSFTFDMKMKELEEKSNGRPRSLISINSSLQRILAEPFKAIQPPDGIHIWINAEWDALDIELFDLKLKFFLKQKSTVLESNEYEGYIVSPHQTCGTLVGLSNKLVLEKPSPFEPLEPLKQVIVPHGKVTTQEKNPHQEVKVDLHELFEPRFFLYEVDPFLQKLRAEKNVTAWLYLAYLHGVTSSSLPDIMTKITGTEMALDILQSPRVWSCEPYSNDSLRILEWIRCLSPARFYYPPKMKLMEGIKWPANIPSFLAHEGYSLIVEKLIKDSKKMSFVYTGSLDDQKDDKVSSEWKTDSTLRAKAYWKQDKISNRLAHLKPEFIKGVLKTVIGSGDELIRSFRPPSDNRMNARIFSDLTNLRKFHLNEAMIRSVRNLLITSERLNTPFPNVTSDSLTIRCPFKFDLSTWIDRGCVNIRDNWMYLYVMAKQVKKNDWFPEWNMFLTSAAFRPEFRNTDHLHILNAIAHNPERFPPPPNFSSYTCPDAVFNEFQISSALKKGDVETFYNMYSDNYRNLTLGARSAAEKNWEADREQLRISEISKILPKIKARVIPTKCPFFYSEVIKFENVESSINELLSLWTTNLLLKQFVTQVEESLEYLLTSPKNTKELPKISLYWSRPEEFRDRQTYRLNLDEVQLCIPNEEGTEDSELVTILAACKDMYSTGKLPQWLSNMGFCICRLVHPYPMNLGSTGCKISNILKLRDTSTKLLGYLKSSICKNSEELAFAGLHWRLVPLELFPVLINQSRNEDNLFQNIIGALGVLMTLEQKMTRCLWFSNNRAVVEKELESLGHENWSPIERPGWLLLEIELGMMIRPIQVKVAELMMRPKNIDESCVTQLNMGEGKTSLIVPMLAVALATSDHLCRVTVLKSLLETNVNSLRHTLGGLVHQRVFTLPCQRDNRVIDANAAAVVEFLKEMKKERAVLVTLREHRLSIQLKGYEAAYKGSSDGPALLTLQRWLDENAIDVLDESDELLDAKYQLVYTMGGQSAVDGGDIRWKTAQRLLKVLPQRIRDLKKLFGDQVVEIEDSTPSHIFPHCRILQPTCFPQLVKWLTEDFLDGKLTDDMPDLTDDQKTLIRTLMSNVNADGNEMTEAEHTAALGVFKDQETHKEILLTLTGYLRYEVLLAGLTKRWKVNYGVTNKRNWNMAVPFRAKDVASERTEFGHPDMAIILTQLSFYYSGLTDKQLDTVFQRLYQKHRTINPEQLYSSWIADIPASERDESLSNFSAINLDNLEQKTKKLFPMLCRCMKVIDFFLDSEVFPKESRVFKGKMTCTAWDLVSTAKRFPTVGFSGTNDTHELLPLKIKQRDLSELSNTNRNLEEILERKENSSYDFIPATGSPELNGISVSEFILRRLVADKVPVLLDCGALMLELNNRAVADKWLELREDIQGVVFFNEESNVLCVRTRAGTCNAETQLEISPFKSRLDLVAVYLDDEHTRGTDLKLPPNFKACVTVGGGLTRDKLVQAAMRMRLLGKGQCVSFLASHEAHSKILQTQTASETPVTSKDVLRWVKNNSKEVVENGLIHWTTSALNFCRKRSGDLVTDYNKDYGLLGKICFEDDKTDLMAMYGSRREMSLFADSIPLFFETTRNKIGALVGSSSLLQLHPVYWERVFSEFSPIQEGVSERIVRLIPNKLHSHQSLDEEQEKEIDVEVFEETMPERPGRASPKRHSLSREVLEVLTSGVIDDSNALAFSQILQLPEGLHRTKASLVNIQVNCWGADVLVTKDFIETVVTGRTELVDEFLRPVNFVVSLRSMTNPAKTVFLVISPYEANQTIGDFRKKLLSGTLHLHLPKVLPTLHGATRDDLRPLLLNPSLCVPPLDEFKLALLPPIVPSSLVLFCGDLYFNSEQEEEAFATFLGYLIRQKRSAEQNEAFNAGKIAQNGFVLWPYQLELLGSRGFQDNPEQLVREIIRLRNAGSLLEESHVVRLICTGRSSFIP